MAFLYWGSTLLVAIMLALSAFSYFFHKATMDGIRDLGFPNFFRIQLGLLKLLALLILLLPQAPLMVKEWAYAGIALFYLTAIIAHIAHKDSYLITLINLLFLGLLIVSRLFLPY
ncbi:DoxX family protein [Marinomonas agarivorans]|nr:DoxX family protein [Marinomonas agarivorans]